ncbi:LytTR family transcriptional regulator [Flagellimonas sp. HMM57]|uniref:LytR/AlgR family response regulator transcription factor n=1 Tax=unclassified Flagellimonas TaxID=2644544 RepID=UPI0013D82B3B|nr:MULTISPECIES: LytTR family DNA-binding domain-containing protein [unclassified Flagellimonas]UII76457.1 LytTR family transcriptional regulator [Flagellimonas sp. HMM57]
MRDRVAILTREKKECIALLDDLRNNGVGGHKVFLCWKDMWLSEQENRYDFILIDYFFFSILRDDIVCYHLFHRYKSKITFYSSITQNIVTQKGNMAVNLYRIFFRPFMDFNDLTVAESNNNCNFLKGDKNTVVDIDLERKYELGHTDGFFLKEGYSLIKFHLSEILCLESDRNYITVYLSDKKHLIRQTLQAALEVLPKQFYRINRSVVVNINKVDRIVGNSVHIKGLNKFRPLISNRYKHDILNAVPLFNEMIP